MKNSKRQMIPQTKTPAIGFGRGRAAKLVAEWQQHGPETLSGLAVRKLRLSFGPTQSVLIASAAG